MKPNIAGTPSGKEIDAERHDLLPGRGFSIAWGVLIALFIIAIVYGVIVIFRTLHKGG